MSLNIISAIIAARDILNQLFKLWELVQEIKRRDELRRLEKEKAERLKSALSEEEIALASRDHLSL